MSYEQPKISPVKMILNMLGMVLIMFAAYEMYAMHETGKANLSEAINWPYYPWVMIIAGIAMMVPFHKQLFQAYKSVKQQQKEWEEKNNKPKF